ILLSRFGARFVARRENALALQIVVRIDVPPALLLRRFPRAFLPRSFRNVLRANRQGGEQQARAHHGTRHTRAEPMADCAQSWADQAHQLEAIWIYVNRGTEPNVETDCIPN